MRLGGLAEMKLNVQIMNEEVARMEATIRRNSTARGWGNDRPSDQRGPDESGRVGRSTVERISARVGARVRRNEATIHEATIPDMWPPWSLQPNAGSK